MDGFGQIHQQKFNRKIRKDLPILFISGDEDPVGNYSKGVWKIAKGYDQIGLNNIKVCLFEDGRHELLHELNKDEVFSAIYKWIVNFL